MTLTTIVAAVQGDRHDGRRRRPALWIVVRPARGTAGQLDQRRIHAWGACLQQGNDPKSGYARTWGYQSAPVAAGVACGATVDCGQGQRRVAASGCCGPGSKLADHTLLEVTAGGELIIAGGTGNGYRFAELMGATNPSGWSGCLKVKNPAGATAGYILLYSNP